MLDIIDFAFSILNQLWVLITSYWFLSAAVILFLLDLVITLVIGTSEDK